MDTPAKKDIIPVLRRTIEAVRPFAEANGVILAFEHKAGAIEASSYLERSLPHLERFLQRVIAFTPPHGQARLSVSLQQVEGVKRLLACITNTGVDLSYVKEAVTGLGQGVEVISLGKTGTRFEWSLPIEQDAAGPENDAMALPEGSGYRVPVFYQKLRKHMQAYTTSMKSLEEAVARGHDEREHVFLKEVNAIILANLGREDFDVSALSRGLALSRSQLYRRLKLLVRLPPSQYIRYVRLQEAKAMLETGEMTVGEVAFRAGFVDKSYFTRAFHRQFGFNPSHLRKARIIKKH
ncbi:MAG: helix-turn-helix domain-containing protein [Phaeodactylibacter sp.]|nr:helix-turn-helix domain-containing protein [Phaeodactylibacter sp.]MCB9275290.1 helix-turn-helix domain-containing protein [Lewinellaceae bacterium]